MSKSICKSKKVARKYEDFDPALACFACKKCGRLADKKKRLCKPRKADR